MKSCVPPRTNSPVQCSADLLDHMQRNVHTTLLAYLEADTEQITLAILRGTAIYITLGDQAVPIVDYTKMFAYLRDHLPVKRSWRWHRVLNDHWRILTETHRVDIYVFKNTVYVSTVDQVDERLVNRSW